jgi:glycosyltransferase involved in cell wall biosynthesis
MSELSVVMATYNRAALLDRCLDALTVQTAPRSSFEIVVVDDGSTDDTPEVLKRYRKRLPLRFDRIENSGQAVALNRAIELAAGRVCLFLDDDVIAANGLVAEHLQAQGSGLGIIGLGNLSLQIPTLSGGLARYVERWWTGHYGAFERGELAPTFRSCYSGNLSVPRAALVAADGFAEWIPRSFDVELAYRLTQAGLPIVFLPEARAVQVHEKDFSALVSDFERAGAAAVEMVRREPPLLAQLPLGGYWESGPREGLARRVLLALHLPPALLRPFDRLLVAPRFDRFYRFVQEYAYWRGARRAERNRTRRRSFLGGVVILLYHAIGEPGEPASRYVLPVRRFARQLWLLRLLRYRVLTLDAYAQHREEYSLPPPRSVIITLDDGYRDNAELAFPLLRRHGAVATIFAVSGSLGGRNTWSVGSEVWGRPLLSWPEVESLRRTGVRFGAHTKTHASLPELSPEERQDEISGSCQQLERRLGPIRHFAYPYGHVDAATLDAVRSIGLTTAAGIEEGRNSFATPLLRLRRCEVRGTDSLFRFAVMLVLGKRPGS